MSTRRDFDIAVAGAGIVGLSRALAAVNGGLNLAVIERRARARAAMEFGCHGLDIMCQCADCRAAAAAA